MLVVGLAWLTLIGMVGCSRQAAVPASGANANAGQLPFDRVSESSGISPTASLPFEGIPAGTGLTIRLQSVLSSADCRPGDSFEAVLDEPVVVAGKAVVPEGTRVTGRVLAAKGSGDLHNPGYLRVTLAAIALQGKSIRLQTSSVFAKGGAHEKRNPGTIKKSEAEANGAAAKSAVDSANGSGLWLNPVQGDVRFSTGHRLTFRLAQPLPL
jgi:hypothetical protein